MPRRKKRYHHGTLDQALVATALAVIDGKGAQTLRLRDIARRAGVSASAVYRHFADRRALLAAVAAEGFAALNLAFAAALAPLGADAPLQRLHALGAAYIDFARIHPGLYRLMFGAERPPAGLDARLDAESVQAYGALTSAVAACCPPGTAQSAVTAAGIAAWSLVHGYAMLRMEGQLDGVPPADMPDTSAILANLLPSA